ncbi:MAG: zinc metallopeptidase [Bacteroidota bacterium]
MGGYGIYIVITLVFSGIGALVSNRLKSKFKQYSQVPMTNNMSGAEVAQRMLDAHNLQDVKIVQGRGFLSDHYNPLKKTISLSPDVYAGRSVAAAAVAAHECGHAVQHAESYVWLTLRSAIVPVVNLAAKAQGFLIYFALGGLATSLGSTVLLITLAAFAITAAFSLITLPVEFDASNRALAWLERSNIATGRQQEGAKDALWWAAMTYVVQALASLATLFYVLMIFLNSRR